MRASTRNADASAPAENSAISEASDRRSDAAGERCRAENRGSGSDAASAARNTAEQYKQRLHVTGSENPQVSSENPAPAPNPLLTLAAVSMFLVVTGFVTVGAAAQLVNVAFGLWFTEIFIFFGVPLCLVRLTREDPWARARVIEPRLMAIGAGVGVLNFVATTIPLQWFSHLVFPKSWAERFDMSALFEPLLPLELALVALAVSLAAPFGEEFFFRGILQRAAEKRWAPAAAVVGTGFVFSAFHLDPVGFAARWELGIVFGLLAWRTKSIWPGMFAHGAHNAVSISLYLIGRGEPQTEEELPWQAAAVAAGVGLPLLWLAWRRLWPTLERPMPEPKPMEPRPALIGLFLLAGLASFAAYLLADFRGAQLGFTDAFTPVSKPKPDAGTEALEQWSDLQALRKRARSGEVPVSEYELRRAEIRDAGFR